MLKLDDIRYDGTSIKLSNVTHAALNTNTPYIYLEKQDYDVFVAKLEAVAPDLDCRGPEAKHCRSANKTCDEFWPVMKNLEFTIDGTTYVIPPEGYTASDGDLGFACMVFVSPRYDASTISLGNMFMRNFVTSYDYSAGQVKLGLNVNAPDGAAINTPDPSHGKGHHHARLGLIIAICVLIVAAIIVGIWYCIDRRRQKTQETKAIAYNEIERYGRP